MIEDPKLMALFAGLIGTLVHLMASGMLLRLSKQRYLALIMIGLFLLMTVCIFIFFSHRVSLIHFLAFFFSGFVLNLFAYGAVAKSLSLEMLSRLYASSTRRVDRDTMDKTVTMNAFTKRTDLLVENGWVSRKNGAYFVSQKGKGKAEMIILVRRFLNIKNSGLYDG